MPCVPPQSAGQVMQQCSGSRHGSRQIGDAKSIQGVHLEMGEQQLCGGHRIEDVRLYFLKGGKAQGEAHFTAT